MVFDWHSPSRHFIITAAARIHLYRFKNKKKPNNFSYSGLDALYAANIDMVFLRTELAWDQLQDESCSLLTVHYLLSFGLVDYNLPLFQHRSQIRADHKRRHSKLRNQKESKQDARYRLLDSFHFYLRSIFCWCHNLMG